MITCSGGAVYNIPHQEAQVNRRRFLQSGLNAATGAAALHSALAVPQAPRSKTISFTPAIPARQFGKTGHELPIFAVGGAAHIERYAKILNVPFLGADRVKLIRSAYDAGLRYFDTHREYDDSEEVFGQALEGIRENVYLATKVDVDNQFGTSDPERVRRTVETSLAKLQTGYVDCIQIHMPQDYDKAMRAYDVLSQMRKEGKTRFIGVTNHANFDVTYKLVATGAFDQVLIAYGYFNGALNIRYSERSREYREMTIGKAHELGMGIVAMKVMGATILGHNSSKIVPEFDSRKLARLPAAAIRWVLADERFHILNIGVSVPGDIEENIRTLRGNLTLTSSDRELLADFSSRAYESEPVKAMRVV